MTKKGNISSKYLEKILDVTFQKYVILQFIKTHSEFSHLKVHAKLMMVNSETVCDVDSLSSLLQIKFNDEGHREIECAPDIRERLKGENRIDRMIDVDKVCDKIIADEIPNIAKKFNGWSKCPPPPQETVGEFKSEIAHRDSLMAVADSSCSVEKDSLRAALNSEQAKTKNRE